jgi:hypothetical protein
MICRGGVLFHLPKAAVLKSLRRNTSGIDTVGSRNDGSACPRRLRAWRLSGYCAVANLTTPRPLLAAPSKIVR